MTLQIANPPQAVSVTIPVSKTRKPPYHTTHSQVTMTKSATALSTARMTIETTVAEMDLSSIN